MAFYEKIGLLVLDNEGRHFLICEKDMGNTTSEYIMPGGQIEEESEEECLRREIREELDCEVGEKVKFIGEYVDKAAGDPTRDVRIKLYRGKLLGEPKPSSEIKFLHWIGKEDISNMKVSQIIRNKIIPDLITKKILK